MTISMKKQFFKSIVSAGQKRSSTKASIWAQNYRIMPGNKPWRFTRHPWLEGMHDSSAEYNIGQKAAQLGFTELVLNLAFFNMDVKHRDCLYVLPAQRPDAYDFSSARVSSAVELSPHLANMYATSNAGHKRLGTSNFYIRGSRSKSGLKSVPIGFLVLDELDEMTKENVPLAIERCSGQQEYQIWMISTPTIENKGINYQYNQSTKEHFFFKCQSCSRHIELTFPEAFELVGESSTDPKVMESYVKCPKCSVKIPHETKYQWMSDSLWIPEEPGRLKRGFHVNQLYSSAAATHPGNIAAHWFRAQDDEQEAQEFNNSKMGTVYEARGARVQESQINTCISDFFKTDPRRAGLVTCGIDVAANKLHCVALHWQVPDNAGGPAANEFCKPRLIDQLTIDPKKIRDLYEWIESMRPEKFVIDAQPERNLSRNLCQRFPGRGWMCLYVQGVSGKLLKKGGDEDETLVHVDRTSWLDLTLGRIKTNTILLPRDIDEEYRTNIKALVRLVREQRDGNLFASYEKSDAAHDHYAHAQNYAEIALKLELCAGVEIESYVRGSY